MAMNPAELEQEAFCVLEGPASMGDGVFLLARELGHRQAAVRQIEYRIVTETVRPGGLARYHALDRSLARLDPAVRSGDGDRASESGGAIIVRHVLEKVEQARDALGVGGSETARQDTGSAVERVDLQAGVVRQSEFPSEAGIQSRLENSVFDERRAGFLDVGGVGAVGQRHNLVGQVSKRMRDFVDLAGVSGSYDKASHNTSARVSLSVVVIWVMPLWARSSRLLNRLRVNGAPSAVDWTSMILPAAVITTFMSTDALESSL